MAGLKTGEALEHAEIITFLQGLSSPSEVIETHAASIVLTGNRAFKLKRPVRLPFLDFSTPAFREKALRRELDLNSPLAPQIYRTVHAVTRDQEGTLALGGRGTVVDWVLEMVRFPADALMLDIARKGPLETTLAEDLALMVAHYHTEAPSRYRSDGTSPVLGIIAGLSEGFREAATGDAALRAASFIEGAEALARRLSPLLDARAIGGAVRRCHGDLHLGNIVMIDGVPVPFDALEFDEALAEIDVLYDLAFLLMDLLRLGDLRAANTVLNGYVRQAPLGTEIDGLATLPLFIALRAAVRAVVTFMRVRQGCGTAENEALASRLLDQARSSLVVEQPCLIAIGGFSGSGKTTMGRGLAPYLPSPAGALHLRTDVERKRLFAVPEEERLSEAHYTQAVSDRVYDITFTLARRALDQGHSVILDAVFSKAEERDAVAALAAAHGARFEGLWLEAPASDLIERVEARRGDASDATAAVVTRQLAQPIGRMSWRRISTRGSEADNLGHVLETLRAAGLIGAPKT